MKFSLFNILKRDRQQYTRYSIFNRKWAYISYIPDVHYNKKDRGYMLSHQNKREALIISNIFYSMGYNIKVALFSAEKECDNRKYDIIFGLEPNFVTMCKKNPAAVKIYYATGAHWKHQTTTIKNRTDSFNKIHNTQLEYSRLAKSHNSCQIADVIFQIGSSFTIQTYPTEVQKKIKIINQSSNFTGDCILDKKKKLTSRKDFMWFGSSGSILKGLDLVLDYFIQSPQYQLHVVGPIDEDFMKYCQQNLSDYSNITFYGFLDTSSDDFLELAYRCSFNIFPSSSEGCPGSVISLMQMGVIPIVSQWAAFDEINKYGYLLQELSIKAIDNAIKWGNSLSKKNFQKLIEENITYSKETWNLKRFENEFRSLLKEHIPQKHI